MVDMLWVVWVCVRSSTRHSARLKGEARDMREMTMEGKGWYSGRQARPSRMHLSTVVHIPGSRITSRVWHRRKSFRCVLAEPDG